MKSEIMNRIETIKSMEDMNKFVHVSRLNTHSCEVSVAKLDSDPLLLVNDQNGILIIWFDKEKSEIKKYDINHCTQLISEYQRTNPHKMTVANKSDLILNIICKIQKTNCMTELKTVDISRTSISIILQFNQDIKNYVWEYLDIEGKLNLSA